MADVNVDDLNLPEDVLAKLAELDLELSEGSSTPHTKGFTEYSGSVRCSLYSVQSVDNGYPLIEGLK